MDEQGRRSFVQAYTKILIEAWSSEQFAMRLQAEPMTAIAEFGIDVPDGVEVVVSDRISADHEPPDLDVAVRAWDDGVATGRVVLYVPSTPQMHTQSMTDDELATVVGGYQVNQCCCTPCCCCT